MENQFSRTEMLLGSAGIERLKATNVAVFGIGGVGGHVAEALARAGVGALDIIDSDKVAISNLNRQIVALHSTIGMYKVDVMAARITDINPECKVIPHRVFYSPETADSFDFSDYDYIVDAIDTVSAKLLMIERAAAVNTPIISAMGAGNKLDPTRFVVTDIFKTSVCPLARVMRYELKKRGIKRLKVVYSEEIPIKTGEKFPGSTSFVPGAAGLAIAGEVVRHLTAKENV